ncbi:MAG: hypothetical protein ACT4TC_00960 [Myxococcaceae bacterium]
MTRPPPALVAAARSALFAKAEGAPPTSAQIAAATAQLHQELTLSLSPIVGDAGFDALFARSLKKTKPAFAFLSEVQTSGPSLKVLSPLLETLKQQPEAAVAEEVVVTLLANFISLLSKFIGGGLAWRLLRNAWPDALPDESPWEDSE